MDIDAAEPVAHRQTRYAPPAGATEFVLVRHGASEAFIGQPFPTVGGHGDPALAADGEKQAELVGQRLAQERVDAIYVTTLRRTAQTAAPFLERSGMVAVVEPDLREVFLGEWEGGLFRQYAADGHPAYLRMMEENEWGHIPGAETSAQLRARCHAGLQRLHARHPDQRVVCVVHGGVISTLLDRAVGADGRTFWGAENASMHTIVVLGDVWQLRRFNDTTHLDLKLAAESAHSGKVG